MQKLITARFTLPVIVIAALVTLAIIAFMLLSMHHTGTAWTLPN